VSFEKRYRYSASGLSEEISQAIFCVAGFAKAPLDQRFNSVLRGRPRHRSNASVPSGFDFDLRRQAGNVDQTLGICDCLPIEGGDSSGKRIDKSVEVSIRQRAIHIAVELGQLARDIVRA